ncbi:MAG: DsbE family thiol:disulfide interchange protein [Pseudomonadales bacterium]
MRRALLFIPLALFLVMGGFLFKGLFLDPTELPSAKLDKPFPAFDLPSLESDQQRVSETDLRGDVVLVNVWATWCPTCKQEHSFLNKLAQEEGVKIVGINYKDDREKAKVWLKRYQDPYVLNILDTKGTLGLDLGVYGAPETYVVDTKGMIRYRHVGAVDANVWREIRQKMLDVGWSEAES